MFDSHVHSNFSSDSKLALDEACLTAIAQHLIGISFTDHLDLNSPAHQANGWATTDFKTRSQVLPAIQKKYAEKLIVINGLEAGLEEISLKEIETIIKTYNFDFVIASIHNINQIDVSTPEYFHQKNKQQAFSAYLEAMLAMLKAFHNFDVIGHIGFVRRGCPYPDKSMSLTEFGKIIDAILQEAIALGKGIEINCSGYRRGLGPLPSMDIVKRYLELGGEIITLGSDAHVAKHIAGGFADATSELKLLGVKEIAYFQKRKPKFLALI